MGAACLCAVSLKPTWNLLPVTYLRGLLELPDCQTARSRTAANSIYHGRAPALEVPGPSQLTRFRDRLNCARALAAARETALVPPLRSKPLLLLRIVARRLLVPRSGIYLVQQSCWSCETRDPTSDSRRAGPRCTWLAFICTCSNVLPSLSKSPSACPKDRPPFGGTRRDIVRKQWVPHQHTTETATWSKIGTR